MTATVKEINKYVSQLTEEEQKHLATALKRKILIAEADRLSRNVRGKKISIKEIIKEIRIVRKNRYAPKSRS